MASKAYTGQTCAYCGSSDAETIAEHVLGKRHFLERHRGNLPKVPSCKRCNTRKSQLENYVMAAFPLGANHAGAQEFAVANLDRRLDKNGPVKRALIGSLKVIDSPSGQRLAYHVETYKLLELMLMVTQGLFRFHFGRPLHRHWEPLVRHVATQDEAENINIIRGLVGPDPEKVYQNLGEGTFEYWGERSRRMPYCSGWRFRFYGAELTGDPELPDAKYEVISSATMRRPGASKAIDADEMTDWTTGSGRHGGAKAYNRACRRSDPAREP